MSPSKSKQETAEELFEQGFHSIPDSKQRAAMSPEKLAIELSKLNEGSPPYILLEHELNLRLAQIQAAATKDAGRYGGHAAVLSAILTALLGYWLGTAQSQEESARANPRPENTCNCTCQYIAQPRPRGTL